MRLINILLNLYKLFAYAELTSILLADKSVQRIRISWKIIISGFATLI